MHNWYFLGQKNLIYQSFPALLWRPEPQAPSMATEAQGKLPFLVSQRGPHHLVVKHWPSYFSCARLDSLPRPLGFVSYKLPFCRKKKGYNSISPPSSARPLPFPPVVQKSARAPKTLTAFEGSKYFNNKKPGNSEIGQLIITLQSA